MGAQVIFVVNHALLPSLNDECFNWLSLQASVYSDKPRTWSASTWDTESRLYRSKRAPECRAALSFSYSDYQATSDYLIAHDLLVQVDHLSSQSKLTEDHDFSAVAREVTKRARYGQYPFHDREIVQRFRKGSPSPITPGQGSLTVFTYDTDTWSWSDRQKSRDMMAKIAHYCLTGAHQGYFGRVDSATGQFSNNFRPLITLNPEQRALVRIHDAREQILVIPQRDLVFPAAFVEKRTGRLEVLKALMASEGYVYEQIRSNTRSGPGL